MPWSPGGPLGCPVRVRTLRPAGLELPGDGGTRVAEGAGDDVESVRRRSQVVTHPCERRGRLAHGSSFVAETAPRALEQPGELSRLVRTGPRRPTDRRRGGRASRGRDTAPRSRGRPRREPPGATKGVSARVSRTASAAKLRHGAMRAATSAPSPGVDDGTGDHLGQHRHVSRVEVLLEHRLGRVDEVAEAVGLVARHAGSA